ncbi:MAG: MMPL family transporter [Thermoleophilaceae bacterium]
MLRGEVFGRIARAAARRPWLVLAVFGVLVLAGLAGSLTLRTSASTDTLVDAGSDRSEATEQYKQRFGDEAIVVLVRGNLQSTLLTSDLRRLLSLERCLSGRSAPAELSRLPAVCREVADSRGVETVYGPATFLSTAVDEISSSLASRQADAARQAEIAGRVAEAQARRGGAPRREAREVGRAARSQVSEQFTQQILQLGLKYGITAQPSIDDPSFLSQLVFDTARGPTVPKARFAYLFPSSEAAVVQVRPRPDLSEEERAGMVELVRRAVADPAFGLDQGGRYVVSGVPVIEDDLAEEVAQEVVVLLIAGLLVMAVVLPLVFRSRMRLLPLLLATGAAALTFGVLALLGGSLTMASIAALPVLIGLAVDYAIQFQARFDEAEAARPPRGRSATDVIGSSHERAAERAAFVGGPVIATAALASALGFLVLLLSPVPMVRGFGSIVVGGVAIALGCALTVGSAALVLSRGRPPGRVRLTPPEPRAGAPPRLGRRPRGGGLRTPACGERAGTGSRHGGAAPCHRTAPARARGGRGPRARRARGGHPDARGLRRPRARARGHEGPPGRERPHRRDRRGGRGRRDRERRGPLPTRCRPLDGHLPARGAGRTRIPSRQDLRPGPRSPVAVPGLLAHRPAARGRRRRRRLDPRPGRRRAPVLLPGGDLRRPSHREHRVRHPAAAPRPAGGGDRGSRAAHRGRAPGVSAAVAGAPALVAEGNTALASPWRRLATLIFGLAAVLAVLLAVRRRFDAAAVPLIPIALAVGWSALVLFLLRIPLNPLSAALGGLVIAISTEFAVLLSARYAEEREAGFEAPEALRRTFDSTGAAVLASGVTAIAGFAALIASDMRMLRDFGIVTVVDLTVSLLGVMIVLPAALLWAEEHGPFRASDLDPRRLVAAWKRRRGASERAPRAGRGRIGLGLPRRRSRSRA